jgi:hypothetical protein
MTLDGERNRDYLIPAGSRRLRLSGGKASVRTTGPARSLNTGRVRLFAPCSGSNRCSLSATHGICAFIAELIKPISVQTSQKYKKKKKNKTKN